MSVKTISTEELRRMWNSEGLILQGCGGSLDDWVDGINEMLTEDGILQDGTKFHDCSTFEHDGVTCLLPTTTTMSAKKQNLHSLRCLTSTAMRTSTTKKF